VETLRTVAAMRAFTTARHAAGERVALVPTMGYLHDGHFALMRRARRHAGTVVSSVFVNPMQFGPSEDLDRYPRDEAGDLEKARGAGCDAVFLPPVGAMYPEGFATTVHVDGVTAPLCGAARPGHFDGVCTVVLKLFNLTGCDVAVFGEKDYQQLVVIRRMVEDLDVPVQIVAHPTVREPDGLAMSSRNTNLDPAQRAQAVCLPAALDVARRAWTSGERDPRVLERVAADRIARAPGAEVDYIDVRDAADLSVVSAAATRPVLLALAVRFGRTRLIDNTVLD